LKAVQHSWFLPFIANTAGWYTAEIGRQPYIIYGVLKTKDAINPLINATNVLLTIIALLVVYCFLTYVAYYLITKIIRDFQVGDSEVSDQVLASPKIGEVV
jgi:cytochrome d ubiquinol oxidase subunit I